VEAAIADHGPVAAATAVETVVDAPVAAIAETVVEIVETAVGVSMVRPKSTWRN
jgi:hypothetical protein